MQASWRVGAGALLVLQSACVSMGPDYNPEAVAALKLGMTQAKVIAELGRQTSTVTLSDGRAQLMWVQSRGTMLGTARARSLVLMFGADGRYLGMSSQSETHLR